MIIHKKNKESGEASGSNVGLNAEPRAAKRPRGTLATLLSEEGSAIRPRVDHT